MTHALFLRVSTTPERPIRSKTAPNPRCTWGELRSIGGAFTWFWLVRLVTWGVPLPESVAVGFCKGLATPGVCVPHGAVTGLDWLHAAPCEPATCGVVWPLIPDF